MTAQEIYDTVKAHLLKQGEVSYDSGKDQCQYRGPNGLKCAVGVLIPDELYREGMEGKGVESVCAMLPDNSPLHGAFVQHVSLLLSLQSLHDLADPELWAERLEWIAEDNGLKP